MIMKIIGCYHYNVVVVYTHCAYAFYQTEVTFINELKPANITVESRLFQTESDPVATVDDFFVCPLYYTLI